jgi:hypothetical protein
LFGNPKVFTGNTKLRSEETGLGLATADKEESAELHKEIRITLRKHLEQAPTGAPLFPSSNA